MNIRLVLTLSIAKLTIKILRLFKHGATTLPGKIAYMLYPEMVKKVSDSFDIIMVTGTNGKTTTSRIIGQILQENGIDYIENKSGANLLSGITTSFINAVNIKGVGAVSTALIEVDEAAFVRVSEYIKPQYLVVTNFFRDQLDRYGELYSTVKNVRTGIKNCPNTVLVLNADDSLCASLGIDITNKTLYYGMSDTAYDNKENISNSDAVFCTYCKTKYIYKNRVYGHLGTFKCPGCGYKKPDTQVTCIGIDQLGSTGSKVVITFQNTDNSSKQHEYEASINLPGLYNIYNSLAAACLGYALSLDTQKILYALESFKSGFGRMETIEDNGRFIKLILVKNPTGFNQVINYLLTDDKNMTIAFIINDKLADGTDVSWLWDVDFERLTDIQERIDAIYTSGIRGEDMAVRLKYADISTEHISLLKDYGLLIEEGMKRLSEGGSFYILPTYTAMLDIRKELVSRYELYEFWE